MGIINPTCYPYSGFVSVYWHLHLNSPPDPLDFRLCARYIFFSPEMDYACPPKMAQAVATQRPMPLVAVWVVGEQNHEEILLVFCVTCGFYPYTAPMEKRGDLVFSSLKVNDGIKLDKIYFVQSKYASEPNPVTSSKNSTTHRANLKLRLLAIPTMWVPPAELEN